MKDWYQKRPFRILLSTTIITLFALLWNALVHLVILKNANAVLTSVHRVDFADKAWISIIVTIAIAFLFSLSYTQWRKKGTYFESLTHSLFFAAILIVVVDLNQYAQYPIPFSLIVKWAAFGILECIAYGLIAKHIIR